MICPPKRRPGLRGLQLGHGSINDENGDNSDERIGGFSAASQYACEFRFGIAVACVASVSRSAVAHNSAVSSTAVTTLGRSGAGRGLWSLSMEISAGPRKTRYTGIDIGDAASTFADWNKDCLHFYGRLIPFESSRLSHPRLRRSCAQRFLSTCWIIRLW
jgi:hypothetical protein